MRGEFIEVTVGKLFRDIAHDYGGFEAEPEDVDVLDAARLDDETLALHVQVAEREREPMQYIYHDEDDEETVR